MSSVPPPPPGFDPPQGSSPPPPPPGGTVAPTPPSWAQSTSAPSWGPAPQAPPLAHDETRRGKPPRPKVTVAAILLIVGGAVLLIGAVLPWLKAGSTTLSGMDSFVLENADEELEKVSSPGGLWIFSGIVLAGLGVALLLAGRNLAVAIISIVAAALGLIFVAVGWGAASDTTDVIESPFCDVFEADFQREDINIECGSASVQAGLPIGLAGGLAALGGSIAATSKRRRWPAGLA